MTDDLDIDSIEARASAATEGPWWGGADRRTRANAVGLVGRLDDRGTGNAIAVLAGVGMDRVADAEFIAHSRTDVPALVTRVRQAEADRDEARAALAKARAEALARITEAAEYDPGDQPTNSGAYFSIDRDELYGILEGDGPHADVLTLTTAEWERGYTRARTGALDDAAAEIVRVFGPTFTNIASFVRTLDSPKPEGAKTDA